jgi:hypothetical protein
MGGRGAASLVSPPAPRSQPPARRLGRTLILIRCLDLSPLFLTLMRLLHPGRFCGTKTPGVWGDSSHSGTRPFLSRSLDVQMFRPADVPTRFRAIPFVFKLLRTLLPNGSTTTLLESAGSALFLSQRGVGGVRFRRSDTQIYGRFDVFQLATVNSITAAAGMRAPPRGDWSITAPWGHCGAVT